jgi:hypothetical protein
MNNPLKVENFLRDAKSINENVNLNLFTKEEKMSAKRLLKIFVAFGLLTVALLAVQTFVRTPPLSPTGGEASSSLNAVGSDWIERHPQVAVQEDINAGSDYFERHPADLDIRDIYLGSDYFERHRPAAPNSAIYIGSDWIERHPSTARADIYLGSDYFERHPLMVISRPNYPGSDWIERNPSNRFSGSDYSDRHLDLVNP